MKRLSSIVLILIIFSSLGFGQQPTIVLTNNSGDELPIPFAKQRRIYVPVDSIPNHWHCRIYSLVNGALEKEYLCRSMQPDTIDGFYKSYTNKVLVHQAMYVNGLLNGDSYHYNDDGTIEKEVVYKDGKKHGRVVEYYSTKAVRYDVAYENDSAVSGTCFKEDGTVIKDAVLGIQKPQFPGGEMALLQFAATTSYPSLMRENDIEGTVYVQFAIDTDGQVINPTIVYSPDTMFSQAVLAMMKRLPKWTPGYENMKPIKVKEILPVKFAMEDVPDNQMLADAETYFKAGKSAYENGDFEKAYEMFANAAYFNSEERIYLLNKALAAIQIGNVPEACKCFNFLSAPDYQEYIAPYLKYCRD